VDLTHPDDASTGGPVASWPSRFGETCTSFSSVARTNGRASVVGVGARLQCPECPLAPAFEDDRRTTVYSCSVGQASEGSHTGREVRSRPRSETPVATRHGRSTNYRRISVMYMMYAWSGNNCT